MGGRSEIRVAGSAVTLDPVETSLSKAGAFAFGSDRCKVRFAGFDNGVQSLLDPASLFRTLPRDGAQTAANVVFHRHADAGDVGFDDLRAAIRTYDDGAGRGALPALVVVLLPQHDAVPESVSLAAAELNAQTSGAVVVLDETRGAGFLRADDVEHDAEGDRIGAVAYSQRTYALLGEIAARGIAYVLNGARRPKLVVCDCDNTLWQGVAGADPSASMVGNVELMKTLRRAKEGGMLLALCSKNSHQDMASVFAAHPDWPLSESDFVAKRVSWDSPKSASIEEMLKELYLSAFADVVLLDDNPVECAEVTANAPGVVCLRAPTESPLREEWARCLWLLDTLKTTATDAKRSDMYAVDAQRREARSALPSFADFMRSLEVNVQVEKPVDDEDRKRVVQLSQRANQFNLTTRRLEVFPLEEEGYNVRVVKVKDKYGDYGLVGALVLRTNSSGPGLVDLDNFIMSCRVLGRGVEQAMMREVGEACDSLGADRVTIEFLPTARNEPAKNFLADCGLLPAGGSGKTEVTTATLKGISFDPEKAVKSVERFEASKNVLRSAGEVSSAVDPSDVALRVAEGRIAMAGMMDKIKSLSAGQGGAGSRALVRMALFMVLGDEPSDDDEESLLFQGLDSLNAVRVLSTIKGMRPESRGAETPFPTLADFLRSPTIADLSDLLDGKESDARGPRLPAFIKRMVRGSNAELPPIVCIHPMSGLTGAFNKFSRGMGGERDIFAIEHPHYTDSAPLLTGLGKYGVMYADAIEAAVGTRDKFVVMSYSGGVVYAIEAIQELRARRRPPALYINVDGFNMYSADQFGHLLGAVAPFPCCCCLCFKDCCCKPCCRSTATSAARKRSEERMAAPGSSPFMERMDGVDKGGMNATGFQQNVTDMFDFFRMGYPEGSPQLVCDNPGRTGALPTHRPSQCTCCGLCGKETGFEDSVEEYNDWAEAEFGQDEWDRTRFTQMQGVSVHNTWKFFQQVMFHSETFGDDNVKVASFGVNLDWGGFERMNEVLAPESTVGHTNLSFTVRPDYKYITPTIAQNQAHNTCMVHDEFVDQLVAHVKPLLLKEV